MGPAPHSSSTSEATGCARSSRTNRTTLGEPHISLSLSPSLSPSLYEATISMDLAVLASEIGVVPTWLPESPETYVATCESGRYSLIVYRSTRSVERLYPLRRETSFNLEQAIAGRRQRELPGFAASEPPRGPNSCSRWPAGSKWFLRLRAASSAVSALCI